MPRMITPPSTSKESLARSQKIRSRYGKDSEVAIFDETYDVVKGKALVAVMWERSKAPGFKRESIFQEDDEFAPDLQEIVDFPVRGVRPKPKKRYMVVSSHTFSFGHFVLIPDSAPVVDVCRIDDKDAPEKAHFVIVDEKHIYASRRFF